MSRKQRKMPYWLKTLTPLALSLATILGNGLTASASPNLILAQVGVRSRVNGLKSLNITPPPGTHIPLPQGNYYYPRYNHHHHRHHHNCNHNYYRRTRRHRGTTIIINPPVYNNPHRRDYGTINTPTNRYIKVIRRRAR